MATYEQLVKALQAADAAGAKEDARALAKAIHEGNYEESQNDAVSGALGLSQGVTFGFGDEISAAIRAGTEKWVAPLIFATANKLSPSKGLENVPFGELYDTMQSTYADDYMDRYRRALGQNRQMLETARREDAGTTLAGELIGGLASGGGLMGGTVKAGGGLVSTLARLGAQGTAMGAASGYGYSEGDPLAALAAGEDVVPEAVQAGQDAAIMGATGGALNMLTPAAGAVGKQIARFVSKPFTKQAVLNNEGKQAVVQAVKDDIAAGEITLDEAKRLLSETPGMTIADLGPSTRELAEEVSKMPVPASTQFRQWLKDRNKEQWHRVFPRLAQALTGKQEDNFGKATRELMSGMKMKAEKMYELAYASPVRITPEMRKLMKTPAGKAALKEGKLLLKEKGRDPKAVLKAKGGVVDTEDMDTILRAYDDVVNGLYRAGNSARAGAARENRDAFRELIYQQNPALRDARAMWASDKANEDAVELGLRIFSKDADISADLVRSMTDSEKAWFKIGALRATARKLGNKSDTADLTKGIFDRPNARDALRVAFGGKQKFDEFMDFIEREKKMFETFKESIGNSNTAKYLAQKSTQDTTSKLAALLGYGAAMSSGVGLPPSIGGYLARKATDATRKNVMNSRMNMLTTAKVNALRGTDLDALMAPPRVEGLLGGNPVPTSAAALSGGLTAAGLLQPGLKYGNP